MSAAPLLEDMERLPCLATGDAAAATTKETAVEMLSVPSPSPPVPQRSIAMGGAAMAFIWARIAVTAPTNSDVTGFRRRERQQESPDLVFFRRFRSAIRRKYAPLRRR